jgi:excisionase family DNA binding protein
MKARQAAERLEVSLTTLYGLLRCGRIPYRKVGEKAGIRIDESEVLAYLERSKVAPRSPEATAEPTYQFKHLLPRPSRRRRA